MGLPCFDKPMEAMNKPISTHAQLVAKFYYGHDSTSLYTHMWLGSMTTAHGEATMQK
jgi:hypothetical protein